MSEKGRVRRFAAEVMGAAMGEPAKVAVQPAASMSGAVGPVDLDAAWGRYHAACVAADVSTDQPELHASLDDVESMLTELAELRKLTATCTCAFGPAFEGPQADCPVHGAVRALNEATRELQGRLAAAKRELIDIARRLGPTDLTAVDHGALVDALRQAGWVIVGQRTGAYVRLRRTGCALNSLVVCIDPEAPEYQVTIGQVLAELRASADEGHAAQKVLDAMQREDLR